MYKKTVPNYTMLRLCLLDTLKVIKNNPEMERMPDGRIRPGFDVRLMQTLAVLTYLFGVETQWSCQGNHRSEIDDAYILLPAGEKFPTDLVKLLKQNNFKIAQVEDYDFDGTNLIPNGKMRWKVSSSWKTASGQDLYNLNEKLLTLLEQWSLAQIKFHLPYMKDKYFKDVVELYKDKVS